MLELKEKRREKDSEVICLSNKLGIKKKKDLLYWLPFQAVSIEEVRGIRHLRYRRGSNGE